MNRTLALVVAATSGFIALSYYLAEIPFVTQLLLIEPFKLDLTVTTALLTLAGYSLNDTIVIFDRIRENLPRMNRPLVEVVDHSVNQTLGRTLLTSLTVFLTSVIIFALNYGRGTEGVPTGPQIRRRSN